MKLVLPSAEILTETPNIKQLIESTGRVCYQSDAINDTDRFLFNIIESQHESVLEHGSITVNIVCDRAVTHELVRHRLAAYSQESQRYCSYNKNKFGNEVTFIEPHWFNSDLYSNNIKMSFLKMLEMAEFEYLEMLNHGVKPQDARGILPNATKTQIVVTANVREWRHIFKLRTVQAAHPDMRRIMIPLLDKFIKKYDILFEDLKKIVYSPNKIG